MDLETVTQSEVSEKKKNKYHILTRITHRQNLEKWSDEPIYKAETETSTQKTSVVWTPSRGKEGRMIGRLGLTYIWY